MLLATYAVGVLCFWCSMLLVFHVLVTFSPILVSYDSGFLCYGLFVLWFWCFLLRSLFFSHSLNPVFYVMVLFVLVLWGYYGLVSLFRFFGVSLIWSLCSDALVLLWLGFSLLPWWCTLLVIYVLVRFHHSISSSDILCFGALVFLCFGVSMLWCYVSLGSMIN